MRKNNSDESTPTDDAGVISSLQRGDDSAARCFFRRARDYFMENAASVPSSLPSDGAQAGHEKTDIFQEAFIRVWTEIAARKIYVGPDGCPWRLDRSGTGRPMTASLITFIMAVARNRSLELMREEEIFGTSLTDEAFDVVAEPEGETSGDVGRESVVELCVQELPPHCREILTMFYYEHKSLDEILATRGRGQSKDGLKSAKSKCLARLRESVMYYLEKLKIR